MDLRWLGVAHGILADHPETGHRFIYQLV